MALQLREIALSLAEQEESLGQKVAELLGLENNQISGLKIVRKGIDARKKSNVLRIYTVQFSCPDEADVLQQHADLKTLAAVASQEDATFTVMPLTRKATVLVVGMGPAGLFSALTLAEAGARVVLLERGRPVAERLQDVRAFWSGAELNPESNIQFGEGGAGTFSDGKLTSRLNHPLIRQVLERLVEFGAPQEILWQAKPHIGSDRLRQVLVRFRDHLVRLGVDIRFSARLTGLETSAGKVRAGIVNAAERIPCDALVLACGHSARDTYQLLSEEQVALEGKPFAIGLRVEHPLELINQIQYGMPKHRHLPAADYRLAWNDPQTGRGVYSFCMCPGGEVVNASSEAGGLVVNGMSDFQRAAPRSNSALVVSVTTKDFPGTDPCAGIRFQRHWEQAAYRAGGANWRAPAQPLLEFLHGRGGQLDSSCRPGVASADLNDCLPAFVSMELRRALPQFEKKMRGFICREASLIGVETRTSAPLRILRDNHGESLSHQGLFPAGEGAGYAGGIMSAAIDGIKTALTIAAING